MLLVAADIVVTGVAVAETLVAAVVPECTEDATVDVVCQKEKKNN